MRGKNGSRDWEKYRTILGQSYEAQGIQPLRGPATWFTRSRERTRPRLYIYIEERYTRCSMYNRAIILAGTSSARIVVVEEENLWSSYARSLTIHARTAYSPRSAVMNWKLHVVQKKNENYLAGRRI